MFHGQKCCYFSGPACGHCVVLDQCPFGQARVSETSCSFIVSEQRIPKPMVLYLRAKPNAQANQLLVAPDDSVTMRLKSSSQKG